MQISFSFQDKFRLMAGKEKFSNAFEGGSAGMCYITVLIVVYDVSINEQLSLTSLVFLLFENVLSLRIFSKVWLRSIDF